MNFLKSWITGIVMLVIFITVVDLLLPDNKYKKYVDLTVGMVVMISIIEPVLGFVMSQKEFDIHLAQQPKTGFYYDVSDVQKKQEEIIVKAYKDNLTRQISDYIRNKYGLNAKAVELSVGSKQSMYSINSMSIVFDRWSFHGSTNKMRDIKNDISLVYNLPVENISILED